MVSEVIQNRNTYKIEIRERIGEVNGLSWVEGGICIVMTPPTHPAIQGPTPVPYCSLDRVGVDGSPKSLAG
jgi:hypothetical protein